MTIAVTVEKKASRPRGSGLVSRFLMDHPEEYTCVMQTMPSAVHPRIVRDPEIVGGSPTIRGTRVPVRAIACLWRATSDRELIMRNYLHLTREDVSAALRYYAEHRAEIDAELLAEEQASD